MHLTFPKFTISDDIPVNGDLRIRLNPLTEEDWEIQNTLCEGTPLRDLNLDQFGTRLDMVNEVLRGRVMTRAQKRSQLNKLRQAPGQNQEGLINNNLLNSSDNFADNSNRDFDLRDDDFDLHNDATRGSSFKTAVIGIPTIFQAQVSRVLQIPSRQKVFNHYLI